MMREDTRAPADAPLVSIVIPVYNGSNYLAQAIDSALAQSYPAVEVVVVDDGSTDGGATERIARSYGDRIRYVRKANGGVATALNAGIETMRGAYFSWLSHDDRYLPDKLSEQMAVARAAHPRPVVVYSAFEEIGPAGEPLGSSLGRTHYDDPMLAVFATEVHGCSLLIPRECFDAVGRFNPAHETTPDSEMWLRIILAGFPFEYVPKVLIQSRLHGEQGSRTIERHAANCRRWNRWAIEEIGPARRAERLAELSRILLRRNDAGSWAYLLRQARTDQGAARAAGVLLRTTPTLVAQGARQAAGPLVRALRQAVRGRLRLAARGA